MKFKSYFFLNWVPVNYKKDISISLDIIVKLFLYVGQILENESKQNKL